MPYKIYSYGKGKFKVCKPGKTKCFSKKGLTKEKAQAQQKALYASEKNLQEKKIDLSKVGSNLEFKGVIPSMDVKKCSVLYKVLSEVNTDLIVVYKLGKDLEQTDYYYFAVYDHNDPKGRPQIEEDPQSKSSENLLKIYDLTPDDVEMAGQDGYERISQQMSNVPSLKEPYEEGLQFEKLCNKILSE